MKSLPASLLLLPLLLLSRPAGLYAQNAPATTSTPSSEGLYAWWSARTNAIQSKQPAWPPPLVTTYIGLFQVVRTDILRQVAPARTDTWNFDNSKGVALIPTGHTEVDIDLPPYIEHNTTAKDGWGDFWVLATFPTGTYKNGSTKPSLAPNLGLGKGFGHFDVQTSIGATLPTGSPATTTSGRPVAWNAASQYQIHKYFWPELESNATFYHGGPNDGKTQEFLTPGLLIGKCGLHPSDAKSRPGLTFGGGMQIATSKLHTYNHELILTARWIY